MELWVRFEYLGKQGFGTLRNDHIAVYQGDMFQESKATGEFLPVADINLLIPSQPSKMIGLWNNFRSRAAKEGWSQPNHPLYFMKANGSFLASGQTIRQPETYDGPVAFEGELGIVIGERCCNINEDEADKYIFGYTCVNDVTARGLMKEDPSFVQWTRAKSFDTFGAVGPVVATGLDVDSLTVRTLLDGVEHQNYPVEDMFFSPREIVSRLSRDMTLNPGDVIACGTSLGAGPMSQGSTVEIRIDGIGSLVNLFE
ncbi:MAG: fumarylacetoacetate hydrolase family protein [Candidatus Thiodiazotropha lotti]|uniref:Fumarylacetoacetate hydrolase family protein n=1 Tax=Candidatus Thiodiazotropha lotti TaxID=2792787 RepID=A0A9E4MXE3_9GAMM|nr:fumarylacetoacetate hydrolase family protein [Candidatus Thiodiazotropha lotti]ODB99133.1 2-hydroxyhepta-2,4-diene-1,7-dioate isomerase [Candidatus Thiodiazotropha endoloripes]MCG7921115.1 fumarylacetoacetate hydrolase family protein [Candidatus Thiodiazotropha lotti]MCG7929131.1 fumarylacetoacetate hydrolase family protein [Candidatus Thiodiazotropha lotti]MCG7937322.1 fumarylacetoacetate hydrolase family protein [Candidatus Thiodiazotropha lotti]